MATYVLAIIWNFEVKNGNDKFLPTTTQVFTWFIFDTFCNIKLLIFLKSNFI